MIEAPFPQEEYESRHQQVQRLMERDGLDLVVASARDNFWYFTGLVSYQFDHLMRPEICFIPREGKPFALVYGNNKTKAEALPWFGEVRSYVDVPFPREMLSEFLTDMGYGSARVGFELDDDQRLGFPVNYLTQLTEALPRPGSRTGPRRSPSSGCSRARGRWRTCGRPATSPCVPSTASCPTSRPGSPGGKWPNASTSP